MHSPNNRLTILERLLDYVGRVDEANGWVTREGVGHPIRVCTIREVGTRVVLLAGGHELHVLDEYVAARDGVAACEVDGGVRALRVVRALDVSEGDVTHEHGRRLVAAPHGVAVELVDDDRVAHVAHRDVAEFDMLHCPRAALDTYPHLKINRK